MSRARDPATGTHKKNFNKKWSEIQVSEQPTSSCLDLREQGHSYRKVICEINHHFDPQFDYTTHIDQKYLNNRVQSDHVALKKATSIPPKLSIIAISDGSVSRNGDDQDNQERTY